MHIVLHLCMALPVVKYVVQCQLEFFIAKAARSTNANVSLSLSFVLHSLIQLVRLSQGSIFTVYVIVVSLY